MLDPQCKVQLLHNSPLHIGANGARTCWDSGDKSDSYQVATSGMTEAKIICGSNDAALIDRVGNKFKHASILEHLVYTFYISGISRALLQELSRHRIASPSVKSTRYTLKELKEEAPFINRDELERYIINRVFNGVSIQDPYTPDEAPLILDLERASRYLIFTGILEVDALSVTHLEGLRSVIAKGVSNDKAKYCMPEAYRTEEQLTINARSLQNFLRLRSDKAALWEIRELAQAVYDALPEDHKYLFTHCMKESHE